MKFQNNTGANVYIDLGGFVCVRPKEILDLTGHPSCDPLTPILEDTPPKPKAKPKKAPKPKKTNVSGTI
mgnify:FL=1